MVIGRRAFLAAVPAVAAFATAAASQTPCSADQRGTEVAYRLHNTPIGCAKLHRAIELREAKRSGARHSERCGTCGALYLGKRWWRRRWPRPRTREKT